MFLNDVLRSYIITSLHVGQENFLGAPKCPKDKVTQEGAVTATAMTAGAEKMNNQERIIWKQEQAVEDNPSYIFLQEQEQDHIFIVRQCASVTTTTKTMTPTLAAVGEMAAFLVTVTTMVLPATFLREQLTQTKKVKTNCTFDCPPRNLKKALGILLYTPTIPTLESRLGKTITPTPLLLRPILIPIPIS